MPQRLPWGLGIAVLLAVAAPAARAGAPAAGRAEARDLGAVGDGKFLNTEVLNRAISILSRSGGGTLHFSAGVYRTGTLYLKSGVTLYLEPGATILGSTQLADYPENPPPRPTNRLEFGRYALISAEGQHDVGIAGRGRIDGQGSNPNFSKKDLIARGWLPVDAYLKRPYGLSFVHCRGVSVRDVALADLGFWCEEYLDCDNVAVVGVTVDSWKPDWNNDGIDIDGCRNVRVSGCSFRSGDDAICLKASYRDCEGVTVTNCTASSLANGIKLGTASNGGFRNIAISNIALDGVQESGITLEIVDGGTLDGVTVQNIAMRNVTAAIFVRLGNMARSWTQGAGKPGVGVLRNVVISDIVAELSPRGKPSTGGSITGLPGHPVENVSIGNVRIALRGPAPPGARIDPRRVPEAEAHYPEHSMFGPLPAYGLYVRHVRGLALHNVVVTGGGSDGRPCVIFDDVGELDVDGLRPPSTVTLP
jgi:polygalacturonase